MTRSGYSPWQRWAHRHGVARILNSSSTSMNDRGTAYIEARGPLRAARRLALGACRHDPLARAAWNTIRVTDETQVGRLTWRFMFAYRRTP